MSELDVDNFMSNKKICARHLKKALGQFNQKNTIVLDNSPEKFMKQPKNLMHMSEFISDKYLLARPYVIAIS